MTDRRAYWQERAAQPPAVGLERLAELGALRPAREGRAPRWLVPERRK